MIRRVVNINFGRNIDKGLLLVFTFLLILVSVISSCTPLTGAEAPTISVPQSTKAPQPGQFSPPVLSLPSSVPAPDISSALSNQARVVRVIDGDTIEVDISGKVYRVRYIGIDTPEYDYSRPDVASLAEKATNANTALVGNKVVRLERDVSETDRYGRLLRYVYVGDLFVNAELVKLGWAEIYSYPPDTKYDGLFANLQREAINAGVGRWATPPANTSVPATTQPANPVQSSVQPAPNSEISLQIVSVTTPAKRGSSATLVARSVPGAYCAITVYYKSGPSTASGLYDKVADGSGNVSWTWTVGTNTTPGSWLIEVKATSGGKTVSETTHFTVQ